MKPTTPANQIEARDLDKNTAAMMLCYKAMDSVPGLIVDARYGLGGWAKAIFQAPKIPAVYIGYEADHDTATEAWIDTTVALNIKPTNEVCKDGPWNPELLLADFNTVTRIKDKELRFEIGLWGPEAIIFTDVACGKLHLNWRAYGLSGPDLAEYWGSWDIPGYALVYWCKEHHAASTALWVKI